MGADRSTMGSWKGVYGGDGRNVINDPSAGNPSYPAYAMVTTAGNISGIWTSSSAATNCLQAVAAGSFNRMAGVWYAPVSFTVDVDITDGNSHSVALYLLDWA